MRERRKGQILAQVFRQYVIGIAFLELGEVAFGFGRLALGPELANVLEPFFRGALLRFGSAESAHGTGSSYALRRYGFPRAVCARGRGSRRRRLGLLTEFGRALGLRLWVRPGALARIQIRGRSRSGGCRLR